MALADRIFDKTQEPTFTVRVNNVPVVPSSPLDLGGVPGVLRLSGGSSYDNPVPWVDIEVNRIPTWMQRGHAVIVEAGYSNEHARMFTGGLFARGDEDPDFLRTQCFVRGATDDDGDTVEATASLVGAPAIWPPVPAGQYIDFAVDNHLIHDTAKAAEVAVRELGRQARIPRRPSGSPTSRTLHCVGDLYGAFRSYKIAARDLSGETVEDAIGDVLTDSGIAAYQLDVPAYTLAAEGALLERMPGSGMLDKLMQIDGCRVQQLASGLVVVRVVEEQPAPTASYTYKANVFTLGTDTEARIDDLSGELKIVFNPLIQIGMTIALEIDYLGINGRFFVWGHRWEIGPEGAFSYLDLRGGDDFGGTIGINPIASFTWTSEQEVIGDAVLQVVTFDASGSFDPDGSLNPADYTWSDNQAIVSGTGEVLTVAIDPATDITGDWEVTLVVEDADGLTGTVTNVIPIEPASTAVVIPAIGAAMSTRASASPDGGQTWNDISGLSGDEISVDFKPSDGVSAGVLCYGYTDGSIKRTTNYAVSATTVKAAAGADGSINDIWWDKNLITRVWACTSTGRLYRSDNDGVTWVLHKDFGGTYALHRIATPIGGGVWVFGGRGDQTGTLIQYEASVGSGVWASVPVGGHLAADLVGASSSVTVAAAASRVAGELAIIFKGAALPGGVSIFHTADVFDGAGWTRATGLDGGLSDGRYIVPDFQPGVFHAAFGNRDVWHTTDGVAYTKTADVLPAGVTPNHALWFGDFIGGFSGVHLVAAENAGTTLGIYKSVDALTTALALRPATGFPAWPAGGKAKMVAIGVAAAVAGGGVAKLASSNRVMEWNGASTWTQIATLPAALRTKNFFRFASGKMVFMAEPAEDTGDIYHYDGASWTATLPSTANVGVYGMDVDSAGVLWAVMGNDSASNGSQATTPLTIHKSVDQGASWSLVHTDPGFGSSRSTRPADHFSHSVITCDKWGGGIYVACEGATAGEPEVIYSEDGGANWSTRTAPAEDPVINGTTAHIAFLNNDRVLLMSNITALGAKIVTYTDDFGDTWNDSTIPSMPSNTFGTICPYRASHFNRVIIAVQNKVYISEDNGLTFAEIGVGDVGFEIGALEYDPSLDIIALNFRGSGSTPPIFKYIEGAFSGSPTLSADASGSIGNHTTTSVASLAYPR